MKNILLVVCMVVIVAFLSYYVIPSFFFHYVGSNIDIHIDGITNLHY